MAAPQCVSNFGLKFARRLNSLGGRIGGSGDWMKVRLLNWSIVMNQPPRNKQARSGEPTLWAGESTDDALPLLEDALREDESSLWDYEPANDVHSLLEENARLRELLVQLSDLIRRNVVHAG
jgi:hypothetical protein